MPAIRAMFFPSESALALLVTRVGADHTHHTIAADDLAVPAHLLDRCGDFHGLLLVLSLGAENDPRATQIVGRELDGDLVTRQDADVVHAHLARDVAQHHVPVFQLDPERGVREILENLPLHLDDVVL